MLRGPPVNEDALLLEVMMMVMLVVKGPVLKRSLDACGGRQREALQLERSDEHQAGAEEELVCFA